MSSSTASTVIYNDNHVNCNAHIGIGNVNIADADADADDDDTNVHVVLAKAWVASQRDDAAKVMDVVCNELLTPIHTPTYVRSIMSRAEFESDPLLVKLAEVALCAGSHGATSCTAALIATFGEILNVYVSMGVLHAKQTLGPAELGALVNNPQNAKYADALCLMAASTTKGTAYFQSEVVNGGIADTHLLRRLASNLLNLGMYDPLALLAARNIKPPPHEITNFVYRELGRSMFPSELLSFASTLY